MAARSYRMAGRDRVWDGLTVVRHVGGVSTPTVEALRDVLTWLGEQRPDHRLFCRLDRARMRWVPVSAEERPAWIERLATLGRPDRQPTDPHPAEWSHMGPDEPQLQLMLFPHSYVIRFNHGIGDYTYTHAVERELLSAALTGRAPEALVQPAVRRPVLTATRVTVRSVGLPFLSALAGRAGGADTAETADGQETTPAPMVAAAPGPVPLETRLALVQPDARARLKEWRTAHEVSEAAALFALTVAALEDLGGPRLPVVVLMDARSTLPRRSVVEGNLLASIVVPREKVASPDAFRQFSKEVYANGRVVAEVARAAAGQAVRALLRRPSKRFVPADGSLTAMTLSYVRDTPGPKDALAYIEPGTFNGSTNGPGAGATLGLWYHSTREVLMVGGSTAPQHVGLLEALVARLAEMPVDLIAGAAGAAGAAEAAGVAG